MSLKTKISGLKEIWQFDNRWWLTVTKTFFANEKLHIYRYKGLEILIDHAAGDANGAREVLTSPMYRRFLPRMKLNGSINVLDLGANNGGFPLLLQAEGFNLKKVVSIELNPRPYSRLRFNLERNLNCEIVALNAAVCDKEQTLEIALGGGEVSDNIYGLTANKNAKMYSLPGITFDGAYNLYFANEIVDVCKLDVEGAEFEILQQPGHHNLTRCRYLIMEIHPRENRKADDILQILKQLDFVSQSDPIDNVYLFFNSQLT